MITSVFVSRPASLTRRQRATFHSWCSALVRGGLLLRTLPRAEYTRDPWRLLRGRLQTVHGAVVFGFRQIDILTGFVSPGTDDERSAPEAIASPWVQIEAGLAISTGVPVLALAETGIADGVFDPMTWGNQVVGGDLSDGAARLLLANFIRAVQVHEQSHLHQPVDGFISNPSVTVVGSSPDLRQPNRMTTTEQVPDWCL